MFLLALIKTLKQTIEELEKQLEREKEKRSCSICMDNDSDACLFPCMHVKTCMKCTSVIKKKSKDENKCPICQSTIENFKRVYN